MPIIRQPGVSFGTSGRLLIGWWDGVPTAAGVFETARLLRTLHDATRGRLVYLCVTAFQGMVDLATNKAITQQVLPLASSLCDKVILPWEVTGPMATFQRTLMQGFVVLM